MRDPGAARENLRAQATRPYGINADEVKKRAGTSRLSQALRTALSYLRAKNPEGIFKPAALEWRLARLAAFA